jgi:DnaJ-class molecular chaperone
MTDEQLDEHTSESADPNVCPYCKGTGKVRSFLPFGLSDPGKWWRLGSAREKTCRGCNGTGKAA